VRIVLHKAVIVPITVKIMIGSLIKIVLSIVKVVLIFIVPDVLLFVGHIDPGWSVLYESVVIENSGSCAVLAILIVSPPIVAFSIKSSVTIQATGFNLETLLVVLGVVIQGTTVLVVAARCRPVFETQEAPLASALASHVVASPIVLEELK